MSSFSETPTMEVGDQQSNPNQSFITQNNAIMPINTFHPQYQEQEEEEQIFPPGYRFCPSDNELIVHYLQKKVLNQPLPHDKIKDVNLYSYNPQHLTALYPALGDNDWYFFTPRDRKYRNGNRPNRAAGDGYWKAAGADKPIKHKNEHVGNKKSLVFHLGKAPKGEKTNWIMKEYTVLVAPPVTKNSENDMRLDKWVLCRVYQKNKSKSKKNEQDDENHESSRRSPTSFNTPPNVPQNVPHAPENNVTQMNREDYNGIGNSNINGFVGGAGNDFTQRSSAPQDYNGIGNSNINGFVGWAGNDFTQRASSPPDHLPNNFNNFGAHHHHHHQPTSVDLGAQQFGCGHHLSHSNQNISQPEYLPFNDLDSMQRDLQEDCLNIPNGDILSNDDLTYLLQYFTADDSNGNNFSGFDGANQPPS